MNILENFLEQVCLEEESEKVIDRLLEDMYSQSTPSNSQGDFYMLDPFAIMCFNSDGTKIASDVIKYCSEALNWWNGHKSMFAKLYFVPPYIRDTLQCNALIQITHSFINTKTEADLPGVNIVKAFYALGNDPKAQVCDDKFFTDFGKVYNFSTKVKDTNNGAFSTRSWKLKATSTGINNNTNPNIGICDISTDFDSRGLGAYEALFNLSKNLKSNKSSIKSLPNAKVTPAHEYLLALIRFIVDNPIISNQILTDTKSGKTNKSGRGKKGVANELNREYYKPNKLDREYGNADYWKDTVPGDLEDFMKKDKGGEKNEDWQNCIDEFKHTFDRKTVDKDLEKIYNIKHLPKDMLGIEDTDSRYNADIYEDPTRKKIKGVSGHDVYEQEKEMERIGDEIADIDEELDTMDVDSPNAIELLKKKKKLLKKQDDIRDKLNAGKVNNEEYKQQISAKNKEKFDGVNVKDDVKSSLDDIPNEKLTSYINDSPDFRRIQQNMFML